MASTPQTSGIKRVQHRNIIVIQWDIRYMYVYIYNWLIDLIWYLSMSENGHTPQMAIWCWENDDGPASDLGVQQEWSAGPCFAQKEGYQTVVTWTYKQWLPDLWPLPKGIPIYHHWQLWVNCQSRRDSATINGGEKHCLFQAEKRR